MKIKNYPAGFDVKAAYERLSRDWDNATICNDKLFGLVMEQEEFCLELLKRALPKLGITRIERATAQKTVLLRGDQHGVRLDVYVEDQEERAFDVEMQVANEGDLPYRMGYYQERMGQLRLHPRELYRQLRGRPTYVIFFCAFDYYRLGKAVYSFENYDPRLDLPMGDERYLIAFNALATDFSDGGEEVRTFLDLMRGKVDNNDKYIVKTAREVEIMKLDDEVKEGYIMDQLEMEAKVYASAEKQKQTDSLNTIKILMKLGLSKDQIISSLAEDFGITKDQAQDYYREVVTG